MKPHQQNRWLHTHGRAGTRRGDRGQGSWRRWVRGSGGWVHGMEEGDMAVTSEEGNKPLISPGFVQCPRRKADHSGESEMQGISCSALPPH